MYAGSTAYIYLAAYDLFSSFFFLDKRGTVPSAPNACSFVMCGASLYHFVSGSWFVVLCRVMLYLKAASLTASSKYTLGSLLCCNVARAVAMSVWFNLSAIPFSCGEYGVDGLNVTPVDS